MCFRYQPVSRTQRPVSVSQMQFRPSWFNIWRLPPHQDEYDETAIFESVSVIENIIIEQVSRGIDSRRIVVCGFSQGAALSLIVGLTTLYELGGIISLSGWIPERVRDVSHLFRHCDYSKLIIRKQMIHTRLQLPVLWCHGTCDIEIPESYGLNAMSFLLRNLQIPEQYLTYRRYDGLAHTINDQELDDVVLWLQKVVGSD